MSTYTIPTPADEDREAVVQARAYVASRFYPPLPAAYGDLAVIALREFREYGEESHVNLPDDLNPLPAAAERDEDGDLYVEAGELIRILHLEHMTWDVDDDPEDEDYVDPSRACRECGQDTGNDDPNTDWGMCGECLHDALRSGWEPGRG